MAEVRYEQATRIYPGTDAPAVDALDLTIDDGEFMVLVGPSGSGKTTALRMLAGLEEVDGGAVLIGGRDVSDLPPKRRDVAMVFQNYALYPYLTVAENIGFPLKIARVKKPVIASMGDVAASGGYYIAMGTDKIFAEPGTLTGSIGVVGGKMALEGLYAKIGLTTTVLQRGKNSGVMSLTTPFSDSEKAALQKLLEDIYNQFTGKAAKGRKMELEKLQSLAKGRVYTGAQAKEVIEVYRTATCGCCKAWIRHLQENGFSTKDVVVESTSPMRRAIGASDSR